ncbi:MAG: SAM-dependent DNA methyltransferase [Chloroflexi bacterium]|nr:SAM-dependent DNA methyltransferase [Chloroflexota bacterium]MBP8056950.1 SAM-dependent DNA methyltransferase [Chloroflexota bacterium]
MAFFVFSRLRFPNVRTVVEETWQALARQHSKQVATHLYGQEINAATYAIATANSLLKGEDAAADNHLPQCRF